MTKRASQAKIQRPLGFSTGCLYRVFDQDPESAVRAIADQGVTAIEIMCNDLDSLKSLPGLESLVKPFAVKSIHLPIIQYNNTREVRAALSKLQDFYEEIGASVSVIHPDLVKNWIVFKGRQLGLAAENMDCSKSAFRQPDDFTELFAAWPDLRLVLDLNHCFTNDKTMALADEFMARFGDRLVEIHLSGVTLDSSHMPLYQSGQKGIIKKLPAGNCPIIIESPFKMVRGLAPELEYIRAHQ